MRSILTCPEQKIAVRNASVDQPKHSNSFHLGLFRPQKYLPKKLSSHLTYGTGRGIYDHPLHAMTQLKGFKIVSLNININMDVQVLQVLQVIQVLQVLQVIQVLQVFMTIYPVRAITKLKGFEIVSLNINSLLNHMDELRVLLTNSSLLDILAINESKIHDSIPDNEINI